MFNGFFRDAAMTSTYKVALLRALADIGGYGAPLCPAGSGSGCCAEAEAEAAAAWSWT